MSIISKFVDVFYMYPTLDKALEYYNSADSDQLSPQLIEAIKSAVRSQSEQQRITVLEIGIGNNYLPFLQFAQFAQSLGELDRLRYIGVDVDTSALDFNHKLQKVDERWPTLVCCDASDKSLMREKLKDLKIDIVVMKWPVVKEIVTDLEEKESLLNFLNSVCDDLESPKRQFDALSFDAKRKLLSGCLDKEVLANLRKAISEGVSFLDDSFKRLLFTQYNPDFYDQRDDRPGFDFVTDTKEFISFCKSKASDVSFIPDEKVSSFFLHVEKKVKEVREFFSLRRIGIRGTSFVFFRESEANLPAFTAVSESVVVSLRDQVEYRNKLYNHISKTICKIKVNASRIKKQSEAMKFFFKNVLPELVSLEQDEAHIIMEFFSDDEYQEVKENLSILFPRFKLVPNEDGAAARLLSLRSGGCEKHLTPSLS